MSTILNTAELSTVFLSYDEADADDNFDKLLEVAPHASRVHGVKGFDAAHRRAGDIAETEHVITVDADNIVLDPSFFDRPIAFNARELTSVISFSAKIDHNALVYGNGGVKIWPRSLLRSLRTHEQSQDGAVAIDFVWRVPYVQAQGIPTATVVTTTPFQAFRSGFREGVRLTMQHGTSAIDAYPNLPPDQALAAHIAPSNLERLRVWCSVGADVPNGLCAIYGARLGVTAAVLDKLDPQNIADYDWIDDLWGKQRATIEDPKIMKKATQDLGQRIIRELGQPISLLSEEASAFVKSVYTPRRRVGTLSID